MTARLRLAGMDLLLFSYVHSLTKDGESGKPFYMSAETISIKWFGDKSKARAIKDSLRCLTAAGLLSKGTIIVDKRQRTTYTSCMATWLERLDSGGSPPVFPKKRRNKQSDRGTVPPIESGIVPSQKVVQYPHQSGTIPHLDSGTIGITESGTTPPNSNILEETKKRFFIKDAKPDSSEEKKELFKILFFNNFPNPSATLDSLLAHMALNGDNLNTFEKRILYAANKWKIPDNVKPRCDAKFLDALRETYILAEKNNDPEADLLIDIRIRCIPKYENKNSGIFQYVIVFHNEYQREWAQKNPTYFKPFNVISDGLGIAYAIEKNK